MLPTHANNPIETASNATNTLLATNTPGYTGGMLAAEQGRGVVSSRVGSRATKSDPIPSSSLIGRMTRDAQVARDAFEHSTVKVDGKTYRMKEDWTDVMDRAGAKYG